MPAARNLLFILADQLNARCLGHAGHPQVRTPHLDALAAAGLRCTDAVCANPICTPSRVSFLSGQYCHNHGYYGLCGPGPASLPSLLSHCRAHGLLTAAIGKIHCPAGWVESACDVFHETGNTSVGGRSPAYEAFLGDRLALEDHIGMPEFGKAGLQSMDSRPSPLSFAESQEGWIAAESIRTMQRASAEGRPFAIHASLPRPHQCTAPSREFWDMYDDDPLLPPTADLDPAAAGKSPHLIEQAAHWRKRDWALLEPRDRDAARRRKVRGYHAAISQVDAAVGMMLEHLRRSGLDRDTLVVFSTDHGEYVTGWGVMEKAPGICADAVTRIPLLLAGPGVQSGAVCNDLVHAVDVAPTACALLGLPVMPTVDGVDLSPRCAGADAPAPHAVAVTEFAWSRAIRKGRWRLVWYPRAMFRATHPHGFGELYDLVEDPWEMRNRWADPALRPVVAELERELMEWLVTTTRPVTSLGPGRLHPGADAVQADGRIRGDDLLQTGLRNYL